MRTKPEKRSHLGVGLYSLGEAARIVGADRSKVRRWLRPEDQLVPRVLDPRERTVTFVELMELHFIQMFRAAGVSLQTIRRVSQTAANRFETNYPFSVKRFDTDGRTVFATLLKEHESELIVEDLRCGQYVFDQVMRPFFKKLDYHGVDEVARYWPLEKKSRVVLDPDRKFGKPIDAETGVQTRALYDATVAGEGQDYAEVAKWFDVPLAAVESAVAFEHSLAK